MLSDGILRENDRRFAQLDALLPEGYTHVGLVQGPWVLRVHWYREVHVSQSPHGLRESSTHYDKEWLIEFSVRMVDERQMDITVMGEREREREPRFKCTCIYLPCPYTLFGTFG